MDNTDIKKKFLDFLESSKISVYDITDVDGYFAMEGDKDSVTHFKVKGCKKWKFAIWVNWGKSEENDKDDISFFSQHIDNIDKFKPSCSTFLVEFDSWDISELFFSEAVEMIKMIRKRPMMSYIWDAKVGGEWVHYNIVYQYLKWRFSDLRNKIMEFCKQWIPYVLFKLRLILCQKHKIIESIKIDDGNKDGRIRYPRWEIYIKFIEDCSKEREERFVNFWFKDSFNFSQVEFNWMKVGIGGVYTYYSKEKT